MVVSDGYQRMYLRLKAAQNYNAIYPLMLAIICVIMLIMMLQSSPQCKLQSADELKQNMDDLIEVGFPNFQYDLKNVCFANSAIQLLLHIPPFYDLLNLPSSNNHPISPHKHNTISAFKNLAMVKSLDKNAEQLCCNDDHKYLTKTLINNVGGTYSLRENKMNDAADYIRMIFEITIFKFEPQLKAFALNGSVNPITILRVENKKIALQKYLNEKKPFKGDLPDHLLIGISQLQQEIEIKKNISLSNYHKNYSLQAYIAFNNRHYYTYVHNATRNKYYKLDDGNVFISNPNDFIQHCKTNGSILYYTTAVNQQQTE